MAKGARRPTRSANSPKPADRPRDPDEPQAGDPAAYWVPVEQLSQNPDNPRDNAAAIEPVAAAIDRFRFGPPIVARRHNGRILSGHTRYQAAIRLGMRLVPVRWSDLDDEDAALMGLADNKLGEIAGWLADPLRDLLAGTTADDARLAGWSEDELLALLDGRPAGGGPPTGPTDATAHVRFQWGDHAGLIRRSVYDAFAARVRAILDASPGAMLEDALVAVLGLSPKAVPARARAVRTSNGGRSRAAV